MARKIKSPAAGGAWDTGASGVSVYPQCTTKSPPCQPTRIVAGQRNVALTALAGALRRRGASETEVAVFLRLINARRCDPPLPDAEVVRIAQEVRR